MAIKKVLITGAAGKTGLTIIHALAHHQHHIRAMIFREAQTSLVHSAGATEVTIGDIRQRTHLAAAMNGCQAVYHICPNMAADEHAIGRSVIAAARESGIEHFVYHSVLHPQVEKMPHHWQKMRVEELLFQSGLKYTILQPASYMQNILAYWPSISEEGRLPLPYNPDTVINMVDLLDVAEAAAVIIGNENHFQAVYELCGKENLAQREIVEILSEMLERPVNNQFTDREEWAASARENGLKEYQVETLLAMFRYYEQFHFPGNPFILTQLLGRAPAGFRDFIDRHIAGNA